MDYYNMMYGRVRHEELIAEAQKENRIVAEESVTRVNLLARIVVAVQRIFTTRSTAKQIAQPSQRLAVK